MADAFSNKIAWWLLREKFENEMPCNLPLVVKKNIVEQNSSFMTE